MRIGIDLGGTKTEALLLDAQDRVLERRRVPTPAQDYQAVLTSIADLVSALEQRAGEPATVGIGTPGSLSPHSGLMRNSNTTCLNGRPLLQDLQDLLQRELRLANDANCFTLAEALAGAAKGYETVFGVILGTGVGGGLCCQGRLRIGRNAIAGEWGHNPMPGPLAAEHPHACYCGRSHCIETYLSGPAFERDYKHHAGLPRAAAAIDQLAQAGDGLAQAQLQRYQEGLARALAGIINILDPDAIVLGGGMSNLASLYTQVPKLWQQYVFSDRCETVLLRAALGDSSGVFGAAWLWPA